MSNNIFVYEGHTSQTIKDGEIEITTGIDLFNGSRINVPDGYRFITFHFNDTPTTANYTGPFILYGLKDITSEDIDSLFDETPDECIHKLPNGESIACKNEREKQIILFKRKMFKSFVVNYINFVTSNSYKNSKTNEFLQYNKLSYSIFKNTKTITEFISDMVNNNFNLICQIHKINIDEFKILGNISKDYIIELLGNEKYNLLKNIPVNKLLDLLSDDEKSELKQKYLSELKQKYSSDSEQIYLNTNIEKLFKVGVQKNVESLVDNYITDKNVQTFLTLIEKLDNNKTFEEKITLIKKKYKKYYNNLLKKLQPYIIQEYLRHIDIDIYTYANTTDVIEILKKTKKFNDLITEEIIINTIKLQINNYYNNDNLLVNIFIDSIKNTDENHEKINILNTLDNNKKTKIQEIIKKNMINKIINIYNNMIISNYEMYKNMENIYNVIYNKTLCDEFYINLFILLLDEKHIETIKNDNVKEVLNYIYTGKLTGKLTEKLTGSVWDTNNFTKESLARTIILRPIRNLEKSISNLNQDLIDRICTFLKFTIRSYASQILTPILSFTDELSFCHTKTKKKRCTLVENYDDHIEKLWYNYKYGFFSFNDYKTLSELPHEIYDYKPSRSTAYGLSDYSSKNKISGELIFENDLYKYDENIYNMIKYYYNHCISLYNFNNNESEILSTEILNNESEILSKEILNNESEILSTEIFIIKNKKEHINKNRNNIYLFLKEIKNYIITINDDYRLEFDISDINNNMEHISINNSNKYLNLLGCFINLYKFVYHSITDFIINYKNINKFCWFCKKVLNNFFNNLKPGTYIITSCGSFSEKLKEKYESLVKNNIIIQSNPSDTNNIENVIAYNKSEQTEFKQRTLEYDTYWKNKYLKYKNKYLYLKKYKYNI